MFTNNIYFLAGQLYVNMATTALVICTIGFFVQKYPGFEKLVCLCNCIAKQVVIFCLTLFPALFYYKTNERAFKNAFLAVITIIALLVCFREIFRSAVFIISMWLMYTRLENYVLAHLHEIDKYNFTDIVNETIQSEMKGIKPMYVDLFLCDTRKLAARFTLTE